MSFGVDVSDWVEKAKENPEEIIRGTAIKLFSGIIVSSPIDEGIFRNNWFISGETPSTEVDDDKAGGSDGAAINRMAKDVKSLVNWKAITFTNNLPYASVIEYGGFRGKGAKTIGGYSKQAPAGVVRINSMRFQTLINEEAAKVR